MRHLQTSPRFSLLEEREEIRRAQLRNWLSRRVLGKGRLQLLHYLRALSRRPTPPFFAIPSRSDSLKGLLPGNLHTGRFRLGQLPFFAGVDAAPLQAFDSGAPAGHFQVHGWINAEEEPLFLRLGRADSGIYEFERHGGNS